MQRSADVVLGNGALKGKGNERSRAQAGTCRFCRFDAGTGDRWTISGCGFGSGEAFGTPAGVEVENPQSLLVLSFDPLFEDLPKLFRVNRDTGARTVVTDCNNTGQGVEFYIPIHIALDGAGTGYVGDPDVGLVRIDLITGSAGSPFDTLAGALTAAPDGATIRIVAGSTAETPVITQPARIEASGGTVRIGD